ncbi:Hypothetical predicted protein [Podarcis lilfordi]|uniref:Uncharacterized protein n=1 Tax=Podarcis lilfordi TaxID=74358 RepID=A0AA35P695_9SAUR|nr:Hypothetical predicted protein [Podarcis lilfordi]
MQKRTRKMEQSFLLASNRPEQGRPLPTFLDQSPRRSPHLQQPVARLLHGEALGGGRGSPDDHADGLGVRVLESQASEARRAHADGAEAEHGRRAAAAAPGRQDSPSGAPSLPRPASRRPWLRRPRSNSHTQSILHRAQQRTVQRNYSKRFGVQRKLSLLRTASS